MMVDEGPDRLLDSLRRLSAPRPSSARDARIRARCHDAMSRRTRPRSLRLVDVVLGAAVALYAVAIVAEGLKVMGGI